VSVRKSQLSAPPTIFNPQLCCLRFKRCTYSHLKSLETGDAVDDDEALAILYVQITHRGELLSAGSVQDLKNTWHPVHLDLFAIEVFNCRVVLLDEFAGNKLYRQSTFANAATAEHDNLVLVHNCRQLDVVPATALLLSETSNVKTTINVTYR